MKQIVVAVVVVVAGAGPAIFYKGGSNASTRENV